MIMKQNKYLYGWNIWTNYGYGWEIESSYYKPEDTYADVKHDAKEYRFAGAQVRITKTRVPNPKYVETFEEMPDGWKKCPKSATTAPNGYCWINNGESPFSDSYKHGLLKL